MKKLLFVLLASCQLLATTAVTENEPDALVEGIVSAITGDLYIQEADIVIQGAEPLVLKRTYISHGGEGAWNFFEHLHAIHYVQSDIIQVPEPNGSLLFYRYHHSNHQKNHKTEHVYILDERETQNGLTNTAKGTITGQTNPKNQYVLRQERSTILTVVCPNGTRRTYRDVHHQKKVPIPNSDSDECSKCKKLGYQEYRYILMSEQLPSGNYIFYGWNHDDRLDVIRTSDPSGQQTYAQAWVIYHGKMKEGRHGKKYPENPNFEIRTSDGRLLQYFHFQEGDHKKNCKWLLHRVVSTHHPEVNMAYTDAENWRGRMINLLSLPGSRDQRVFYYNKGKNDLGGAILDIKKEYDFPCSRVRALSAPVTGDGSLYYTHRFRYFHDRTDVTNIDGNLTQYRWTAEKQLASITRYLGSHTVYNQERFIWGPQQGHQSANLLCKSLTLQAPLFATRYFYDDYGNVLQEKFYGNLSGQGSPLALNSEGYPIENGVESKTTHYKYTNDGRHLLIYREESNGFIKTFDYMPGTNLCTKEFTYDHNQLKLRKFYAYQNGFLVQEIIDDGSGQEPGDLTAIRTRLIKTITLHSDSPYIGMPKMIDEKYWDGSREQLLKRTVLHYTTGGRISQKEIYDAEGRFCYNLIYRYDEKCRLRQEVNAMGQVATTGYDEAGNKNFFQDFGAQVQQHFIHDCANRLVKKVELADQKSRITTHTYDTKHNRTSTTDYLGNTTTYTYDAYHHLRTTQTPDQGITTTVYDAAGRELQRIDARGYITTTEYNARGQPICINYPDGTSEVFTYTIEGTLQSHKDKTGVETSYTYDFLRRCTSKVTPLTKEEYFYDAFNLISKIDADGNTTTYTYDGAGRKIAEECYDRRIEYIYDSLGRTYKTIEGNLVSITEYDFLNRPIEERRETLEGHLLTLVKYDYDDSGNQHCVTRFVGSPAIEAKEYKFYDPFNRLIKKVDPTGETLVIDYDETHKTLTKSETDLAGLTTLTTYNEMGRIAQVRKTKNGKELFREEKNYDLNGNLTSLTSYARTPQTIVWEFDSMNRVIKQTESDRRITEHIYQNGLLDHTVKPSGVILTRTYDDLSRLQQLYSSDNTVDYTYQYDGHHRITSVTDELTKNVSERRYDPLGNLIFEQFENGLAITADYKLGKRESFTLPNQQILHYLYGPLYLNQINYGPYTHQFKTYDLSGNLLVEQTMAGWSIYYTYDVNNRQTSFSSPQYQQQVWYDSLTGNLKRASFSDRMISYTYSDLYQLTSENGYYYDYDAMDNRHQKNGVVYNFDTLNQLSSLQYDANGNPISMGNALCTYDALDRLISLETSETLLHFTYDFDHRRLSKTVYTKILDAWQKVGVHSYFYDKRNEIGAFDSRGNLVEFRILNPTQESDIGSSIAFDLSGELYIPLHDVSGNVVATVSQKTGFLQTIQLSAFGEESTTSSLIPWRFSSKRLDLESGLYNFGRRYYDPQLGRWLTPDPAGYDEGANLYAFVGNNPLIHSDPYGLWVGPTWSVPPISITTPWVSPKRDEVSAAVVHAAAHASLTTATMATTAGFLVTIPARSIYNWTTGASTLSRDWAKLSCDNQSLINTGMYRIRQWYPVDTSSSTYQWTYAIANTGFELGTLAIGGLGLAKTDYSVLSSLELYGHWTRSSQKAVLGAERLVASTTNKIPTPIRIGRGKNRFVPDPAATTAHSRFRYYPPSSKISHYETFQPQTNSFDPKPWESVKRFDNLTGNHHSHFNKVLKQEIFEPHVHDPTYPGGVRHPFFWEIPK